MPIPVISADVHLKNESIQQKKEMHTNLNYMKCFFLCVEIQIGNHLCAKKGLKSLQSSFFAFKISIFCQEYGAPLELEDLLIIPSWPKSLQLLL